MKPTDLRGILRYIPRFRQKTFVISVDGGIVADDNFGNILMDVAVLRSLNIRVVLVHGAAAQIEGLAADRGVAASNLDGAGVTDRTTLDLAIAAANRITHGLLERLSAHDLRAAWANAVIAHPLGIIGGVDHQFTGKVERVEVDFLQTLLNQGIMPVVPPVAFDGEGSTFRVNSDAVARAVAEALGAVKLIYVTIGDGLVIDGEFVRQIQAGDLERMLAKKPASVASAQRSKAAHGAAACKGGVPRVHIINGRVIEGLLAEVFSNEGIGTLIFANEYQQIRPARKKDIRHILNLTKTSVANSELIRRTRPEIERNLGDYFIYEIDNNPVACIALHLYQESQCGELAFLCVSASHENMGIGRKMVQFVIDKAKELKLRHLILLSTQAFAFFQTKCGFSEGTPDDLPPSRRELYDKSRRNSRILVQRFT